MKKFVCVLPAFVAIAWGTVAYAVVSSSVLPSLSTEDRPRERGEPVSAVDGADPIVAPTDQILLISTRGYPTRIGRTLDLQTTMAREYGANGHATGQRWSLADPWTPMQTWVFVHGNQIPRCDAIRRGLRVYRRLRSCASHSGPVRFVIWSWPSERTAGRLKDAREKACRTDVESFLLGSAVTRLAAQSPVSILGYSFGSRIVSGALHLAAGGQLCGYTLPETFQPAHPLKVVYIAAAVEHDAFARCGRYRQGLSQVQSLALLNNSRDPALSFFWVIGKSHPKAMGDVGVLLAGQPCQVQQTDWAKVIGREHSLWEYIDRPNALRRIVAGVTH